MFCSNTGGKETFPAKVADKEKGIDAEDAYNTQTIKMKKQKAIQKNRLGVRYDLFLAFIIAGI